MAYPIKPNPAFFVKPDDLKPGLGTTVTPEGHIFGYCALWNVRLIGSGNKNTRPPKSKCDYSWTNVYNVECEDGSIVRTGVISGDGGHYNRGSFKASQRAYADISCKVANVVFGEDEHGVWYSGALSHRCDEAMAQDIRSSGVSGHWERPTRTGSQELLGACCVNIAGFPQQADHRIVASATITPTGGITLTPELDPRESPVSDGNGATRNIQIASPGLIQAAATRMVPVSGTLAALNVETPDGRQVNNVEWERLPLPLWYSSDNGGGHWGAKIVGHIEDIQVTGSLVTFTGQIEQELGENANEAEIMSDLGILGISMDGYAPTEEDVICEYDEWGWPMKYIFENYKIVGATLTLQPAFEQTIGVQVNPSDAGAPPAAEAEGEDTTTNEEPIAASAKVTIKTPVKWQ